jgi:hypothetical protein
MAAFHLAGIENCKKWQKSFLEYFPCFLNGIKISQKKQKNKVFPTANTKESVKR